MKCEVLSRQWCGMPRGSIVEVSDKEYLEYQKELKPLEEKKPEPMPEPKKKLKKKKGDE